MKQKTILVVEDDLAMRNLVVTSLRAAGYRVLEAEHPSEAARLFGTDLFGIDLLFADIYMPTMSGPEFAKEMLAMRRDLKVIFATGTDQKVVKETMELTPHKHFLQKPYTVEELRAAVAAALSEG